MWPLAILGGAVALVISIIRRSSASDDQESDPTERVVSWKTVIGNNGAITVQSVGNNQWLRPDAADAFTAMAARALQDGIFLTAGSGFRDIPFQTTLYNAWKAGTYNVPAVAKPGTSNHGIGVAIDLADGNGKSIAMNSPEFAWVTQHGADFGFSWAEGRSINEPWHWDYVG